ncbi:restriction endonuclease subunit S [Thiocapsa marina]|uniref:Restriction modification system DNA specificity domain protein n=1 Tax=Thiocapsa marina 5811 TaxID=768671 RepID=F9UD01_9GAMM|nr:restriction endonuclease subunit S [Thiocapsa marina]EGV17745.1 restriction modification system DNA specificity domain protein [Thiocapsa marina 5811]
MNVSLATSCRWRDATLQDLVFFQRGYDITKAQQHSGNIPVISSSGITSFHNEAKAQGPGVVIGRKGTLGSVHYSAQDYWPHDTTLWSRDLRGNIPRFVYYFLHTIDFKRFDVGNSNPTLNRNHIHALPIKVPPLDVQESIASILCAYDDLIENNRRRMALLEEAARQLYREWFVRLRFPGHEHTRIIDGLPEGWERKSFNEVCQTVGGGTPSTTKSEYWDDGDIIWVTPTDITRNPCLALLDSEKKITEAGLKHSSAKMLPPNTIMMTSRASVGFFGLIDKAACTNQGFISVVPNEPFSQMYLLHNLMHRVDEIRSHAGGATYKEISKSKFKALPVVMPSLSLLRDFGEQTAELLRQIRTLHTMNVRLNQARDILLPRLMSGEIAV